MGKLTEFIILFRANSGVPERYIGLVSVHMSSRLLSIVASPRQMEVIRGIFMVFLISRKISAVLPLASSSLIAVTGS